MKERLLAELSSKEEAEKYLSRYWATRERIVEEVAPHIAASEPSLTDHGPKHLSDVLRSAGLLLDDAVHDEESISAIDLYCLGLIILFHDVGNVYGRTDHQKRIAEVFRWVRQHVDLGDRERYIVVTAGSAHTGKTQSGSVNTLKEVEQTTQINGHPVRLMDLAAILRLADELSEGPQRTSRFMQAEESYDPSSLPFHEYANITQVYPDRGNGRIALTYDLEVGDTGWASDPIRIQKSQAMLAMIYSRILKVDQERQYAKHYCDLLAPFQVTSVRLNFASSEIPIYLDLGEIKLTDLVLPGDNVLPFEERFPQCRIDTLLRTVAEASGESINPSFPANVESTS